MDNNQNNNPFPGGVMPPNRELGTGEGETPLTIPDIKPENLTARTMSSDISSVQTQGGGQPVSYTPNLNQPKTEVFIPPQAEMSPMNPSSSAEIPSTVGIETPSSKKPIVLGLASFVIVIALGAIGWFVVYPNFVSNTEIAIEEVPVAVLPTPEEPQPPVTSEEPASSTSTTSTTTPEENAPKTIIHSSFFKTPADAVTEFNFVPATLENYKTAFPGGTAEVALLKEVVFKGEVGGYSSAGLLNLIAPKSLGSDPTLFAEDFTAFSYTDKNGVWPGLVLKIAENKKEIIATALKTLETTNEASAFFGGTTPGTATAWKNGKIGTYAGRYMTFTTTGASLNYAVAGDYLVISTSYAGAQEVAKRLGL
jgi:hypothetical protein